MNVRGMTDKELEGLTRVTPLSQLSVITAEFHRRREQYKRNLRRYQKRFKQGEYGVQRKSN